MALADRVKKILLTPKEEWQVIDPESATVGGLYTGYIIPLAAIGPIAHAIGSSVFGLYGGPFGGYRVPLTTAVTGAVVMFVLSLVSIYLIGLIIDALAPTFGATRNPMQALKVAAYASTAALVAGVFAILPGLQVLQILGLYSLYLLFLGLPVLMKAPKDKALGYTAVVVIAAIVLNMLVGMVAAATTGVRMW
jgi:hypothetical protein